MTREMKQFFSGVRRGRYSTAEQVAVEYGKFLWKRSRSVTLVEDKNRTRSRFYLGLQVGDDRHGFEKVTKRAALISDTLLLAHDPTATIHFLGAQGSVRDTSGMGGAVANGQLGLQHIVDQNNRATRYGMHCPDLDALGQWLLDAQPLLEAGLAWYLPTYSTAFVETRGGVPTQLTAAERARAVDYLIEDGRAIDASGADPIKSQLIRPILSIELPFIDGVGLRDFSRITVGEFNSYSAFRDYLRLKLLDIDPALNAVDSERQLLKLALEIKEQIRASRAEMEQARHKRFLSASGAAVGTVGAALVAVYGPALESAVGVVGTSGGIWAVINALADNSTRRLREDRWHYMWTLSRTAGL
ncbi:hypothetical protein ACGFZQ_04555 [Streptomyces sp. NPDC048254]|uniref:hypothetical protein n=1 Tax=Streptomyces sp. NPDC048254 TaxID=3365525 RepID=UPI00371AA336